MLIRSVAFFPPKYLHLKPKIQRFILSMHCMPYELSACINANAFRKKNFVLPPNKKAHQSICVSINTVFMSYFLIALFCILVLHPLIMLVILFIRMLLSTLFSLPGFRGTHYRQCFSPRLVTFKISYFRHSCRTLWPYYSIFSLQETGYVPITRGNNVVLMINRCVFVHIGLLNCWNPFVACLPLVLLI